MSTAAVRVPFTPRQRAFVARAIETEKRLRADTATVDRAASRQAECDLAERLLPHLCVESTVDRAEHALGVARMILNAPSGVR